jgi:hypothetical protein
MTAQVSDLILISNEKYSLHTNLALPDGDSRFVAQQPHADPATPHFFNSTACWRRYIATWEIREDHLYLTNIEGYIGLDSSEPILADWVTSTLTIPQGECLQYVHGGFGGYWEAEIRIEVENGRVLSTSTHDMRPEYEDMKRNEVARQSVAGAIRESRWWQRLIDRIAGS